MLRPFFATRLICFLDASNVVPKIFMRERTDVAPNGSNSKPDDSGRSSFLFQCNYGNENDTFLYDLSVLAVKKEVVEKQRSRSRTGQFVLRLTCFGKQCPFSFDRKIYKTIVNLYLFVLGSVTYPIIQILYFLCA